MVLEIQISNNLVELSSKLYKVRFKVERVWKRGKFEL